MRKPNPVVQVSFQSHDRTFLESKGWAYIGSKTLYHKRKASYRHLYSKDNPLLLYSTREAIQLEIQNPNKWSRKNPVHIPASVQALNVSRQRKLQIVWKLSGCCVTCGVKRELIDGKEVSKQRCLKHLVMLRPKQRERNRIRMALEGKTYKVTGQVGE